MVDAGDFADLLAGHAVLVVLDDENDRAAALELRHAGEVVGLVGDAVVGGPVADQAGDDPPVLQLVTSHGRAGGDGIRPADDGVRAEVSGVEVGDVHPAAATVAVAQLLAEKLGHRAVDVLLDRAVEQAGLGAVGGRPDELAQVVVIGGEEGVVALGDGVSVAAVGRGDVIVVADRRHGADGDGFLAHRKMGRADELETRQRLELALLEGNDHLLEETDGEHRIEHVDRVRARDTATGGLIRERVRIGEHRNRLEGQLTGGEIWEHR